MNPNINMKTLITSSFVSLLLISGTSYADLVFSPYTHTEIKKSNGEIVATYSTETTIVSGTGTTSDFGSTFSYSSLMLNNADITLNDPDKSKKLLITSTSYSTGGLSVSTGSAFYGMLVTSGANKLTIKDGGSINISAANSLTVYDTAKATASLELTIDSTAGDVLIKKAYINKGEKLTLNLHKVNALGVGSQIGSAYGAGAVRLEVNMDCDQNVSLDFRNTTISAFNITNGATLTVSGWGYVASGATTSKLILADELKNGSIFFSDKCSDWNVESWDAENSAFTVKRKTNTMTIYFVDENEEQLKNLSFSAVEGGWLLTGMQAVPEPAEWAMIFGGIALGLAIYRRRK